MRTPEPLPSGRYKVRFRLGEKQTSETFDSLRKAQWFCEVGQAIGWHDALDQLYAGEHRAGIPTLNEVAADYIRLRTAVTEGTRLKYTRLWAHTWAQLIGGLRADQVTKDAVSAAVIYLSASYSAKSLKNQRGLLYGVLERAVENGHLSSNPGKRITVPRSREHERRDMVVLTTDSFAGLLERVHTHYQPFVMFLAGTGARFGEAVALEIQDVALPNVRIRQALQWSPDNNRHVGPTKTRRSKRTIALPPQLADAMRHLLDRSGDALMFTAPRGGMIAHRTFWSDIWLPAVRDMDPRPRIHDLRHSHASWLLAAGVPIHVVQARLGHESIQTTVDTYSHLLPDAQLQAANAAALVFKPRQVER